MGLVYRAQDPAIGRVVAIKTIRLSDLTDESERERMKERLFREAQSAGALSHPNIVTIYDIAQENGTAYIFMEFVDGPSLERVLASDQPPDNATLFHILRQTAAALDYAHAKGIVHRDIKPANILLHERTHAKITDFGVARIISQQMTQSGGMMGTPNYMSPEQVQGHAVDGRADQFGLAVITYEILTGEKPFVSDYLPTLLYKIVREDPAPPRRLNSTLAPEVDAVLARALAKDPAARYSSCREFVSALELACNKRPDWKPLARGAMQSMPTLAGTTAQPAPPPIAAPPPPEPPVPRFAAVTQPIRPDADEDERDRNPIFKSVFWVLVGIGVVGLALLAAQRFLMQNPPAATENQQQTAKSTELPPAPAAVKPSPAGESPPTASPATAPPAAKPPVSDTSQPPPEAPPPEPKPQPKEAVAAAPASSGTKQVQFITQPPGANVVIDDNSQSTCRAPCMLTLPAGRHTLRAESDGYRTARRIFYTPQDSDVFLTMDKAQGVLSITSNPPGAAITLNGQQQSQKTPAALSVPAGNYAIRLSKDGTQAQTEVTLHDGELHSVNLQLQ